MNIADVLGKTASVAVAVERMTEVLKPVYLALKTRILKKEQTECSRLEKTIITILLSIFICMLMGISADIPDINETSIIQEVLAGLIASLGSNILHMLLSILTGVKDTIETRIARMRNMGDGHPGS